jgi:hypothetical protein
MATVHDLAAAGRYPHLTSWLAHPSGPSADEQFDLGLGFLLDGIATRLQAGLGGYLGGSKATWRRPGRSSYPADVPRDGRGAGRRGR